MRRSLENGSEPCHRVAPLPYQHSRCLSFGTDTPNMGKAMPAGDMARRARLLFESDAPNAVHPARIATFSHGFHSRPTPGLAGLAYFIVGHRLNIKAAGGRARREGSAASSIFQVTFQSFEY